MRTYLIYTQCKGRGVYYREFFRFTSPKRGPEALVRSWKRAFPHLLIFGDWPKFYMAIVNTKADFLRDEKATCMGPQLGLNWRAHQTVRFIAGEKSYWRIFSASQ